ncbi:MAG: precorrin-3B C(17)-methyltransferase [Nitrospirota bacterium]
MTLRARDAIEKADAVVGYSTYIRLIGPLLKDKDVISTGMTTEVERCREAIRLAAAGQAVALISSGDPGIYGMAGLVLELLSEEENSPAPPFDLEIIPGVPAVCSAAASIGAPLMHDFAVISLSDLLTPWELIEKRLSLAAQGDFVIALYNPRSKGRPENLAKALEVIRRHRAADTPVGVVKDSSREGERITLTSLKEIPVQDVDMTTMVIIGNSSSFSFLDYIVTPRGYKGKRL